MTTAMSRYSHSAVLAKGLKPGTEPENVAALHLLRAKLHPEQQHSVGPYRLDFAFPAIKVAVEVDGWHHARPETAAKDAERDAYLRRNGWLVFRVNDEHDDDGWLPTLDRVFRVVHLMQGDQ